MNRPSIHCQVFSHLHATSPIIRSYFVAAKKRREKRTHQKQKLPPNRGSEHEPPPSKRPRGMMAPSIPASARDIADSPLPSLETSVSASIPS
ncbi:hypothetical protein BS47DRAFT_1400397 [Hydnum rufescens UP504]|uniref:Uncharacterized protein n=1 Tax=Hydnum rufescens UP504 TaxID=1448309 RepID=A0A9P6AGF6_9AGAM|nr:hypothetical protein BS47DRAFT_1400397 [Hydnum rufescens UP504]